MEMYTNSRAADRTVFLEFPAAISSVDVFVYRDEDLIYEVPSVTPVGTAQAPEGLSVTLPLHLLQHDGDLRVYWTLRYMEGGEEFIINRITPVEVVTPILTRAEIRAIDPQVFDTDAEIVKIEKAVRHVVQAYTGQEFGHFIGTEKVKGDGGTALFLPRRLMEVYSIDGVPAVANYVLDPEGYILRHTPWGVPPVKADFHGLHYHTGGVIHNPNHVSLQNWNKRIHVVSGRWGWEAVPEPVKQAAGLLVNDYACADSQYRDRYLTSMTAADWRIQFNSGAFVRTGNVRADQLLSDFVVTRGWGVI